MTVSKSGSGRKPPAEGKPLSWMIHKLWMATRTRCPSCEQGKIFSGLFKIERLCSVCGVRFERQDGESIGGMIFNFAIAVPTALAGFFISEALFHPPLITQLLVWSIYIIAVVVLLYRHTRGLWIGISYLTGGVMRDEDTEVQT